MKRAFRGMFSMHSSWQMLMVQRTNFILRLKLSSFGRRRGSFGLRTQCTRHANVSTVVGNGLKVKPEVMAAEFASLRQMLKFCCSFCSQGPSKYHLTSAFARTYSVFGEFGLICAEHERFERGHGRRPLNCCVLSAFVEIRSGESPSFWACR